MDDDYKYWRIRKKPVIIVFGLLFFLWLILLVTTPSADFIVRTKVSELMVISSAIKEMILDDIIENQSETISGELFERPWPTNASEYLSYTHITKRGKIFLFSEKLGVLLTFTPSLVRDEKGEIIDLTWICYGLPKKNVSANCR